MTSYTDVMDAFAQWAEEGADLHRLEFDEGAQLRQAVGMMKYSQDIMPDGACEGLDLPAGSAYSQGMRAVADKAQRELSKLSANDGPLIEALRIIRDHQGVEAMKEVASGLLEQVSDTALEARINQELNAALTPAQPGADLDNGDEHKMDITVPAYVGERAVQDGQRRRSTV